MPTKKKAVTSKPRVKKTLAEKYAKLFPITRNVTKTIITKAQGHLYDGARCIGALTLKAALGANFKDKDLIQEGIWGASYGELKFVDGTRLTITTEEKLDMMEITTPTKVTLIIQ